MANIDLKDFEKLKEELDFLNQDEVLFLDEDGINKYAVIPMDYYEAIEDMLAILNGNYSAPMVKLDTNDIDLSYDEYEKIKKQILEAVEKTLMPKPEKLN